jgi:SAM-dependent methyltransferase
MSQIANMEPAAWVLAAANAWIAQTKLNVPQRWLVKLARDLGADSASLQPIDFDSLPRSLWNEPSLLGEVLAAARDLQPLPKRDGRAGRVSAGCIYTPAAVARTIVAEVHVGARRVVDPACGAGVFLLEAFERAYRRRLEGGATPLQAARSALSHEITGVDIDPQALAVTEFSLRLLALRLAGLERDVPIDLRLQSALDALADLDGNCECIVGNPPFVEGRGLKTSELAQLRRTFKCAESGKVNLFAVFVERALSLLKDGGVMALVLPSTFQRNTRYRPLRQLLLQHTLESIKPLDPTTFGSRVVETVVLRVRKKPPLKDSRVQLCDGQTLQSRLPMGPVLRFCDHLPRALRRQIELMERHGVPLSDCFEVRDGISTGFQPFPQKLLGRREGSRFVAADGSSRPFNPAVHKRIIDGCEFHAFTPIQWAGRYIDYDKRHEHTPPHPGRPFNCQLRDLSIYDRAEKIVTRQTAKGIIGTVDRDRFLVRNSVHVTFAKPNLPLGELSLNGLCACLNSSFYTDYLLAMTGENGDVFPQVHVSDIRCLPILPGLLKPGGALAQLGTSLLASMATSQHDEVTALKTEVESLLSEAFGL